MVIRLLGDATQYEQVLQNAMDKTTAAGLKISADLKALGQSFTKNLTEPIIDATKEMVSTFAEFESNIVRTGAILRTTEENFAAIEAEALRLGATTRFFSTDIAKGMSEMAKSGLQTEEILAAMGPTLDLAAAELMTLAEATERTLDVMAAFQLPATELSYALDVVGGAALNSRSTLIDMANGMRYAGPVAQALGISIEDTAAALATLAQRGYAGAQSGRSFRTIMSRIAAPTKDAANWMRKMGVSIFDSQGKFIGMEKSILKLREGFAKLTPQQQLQAQTSIAGRFQLSQFIALIKGGPKDIVHFGTKVRGVGGIVHDVAEKQMDTFQGSMLLLQSAVEGAAIRIATLLVPAIRSVMKVITEAVSAFNEMPDTLRYVVIGIGAFLASLGPLMLLLASWKPLIFTVKTALFTLVAAFKALFLPLLPFILLIAAAILLFVAYAGDVETAWKMVRQGVIDAAKWMKRTWKDFVDYFNLVFIQIKDTAKLAWQKTHEFARAAWAKVKQWAQAAWEYIVKIWDKVTGGARITWKSVSDFALKASLFMEYTLRNFEQVWDLVWTGLKLIAIKALNLILNNFFLILASPMILTAYALSLVEWEKLWDAMWEIAGIAVKAIGVLIIELGKMIASLSSPEELAKAFARLVKMIDQALGGVEVNWRGVNVGNLDQLQKELQAEFDRKKDTLNIGFAEFARDRMAQISAQAVADVVFRGISMGKKAAETAASTFPGGPPGAGPTPTGPVGKVEAVLARSAEGRAHIGDYLARIAVGGAGPGKSPEEEQVDLLEDIKGILQEGGQNGNAPIVGAGLG